MRPEYAQVLRELLQAQAVASLGTLHRGRPFVSMVPFAILPGDQVFLVHVSQLASHTKDMLLSPRVSLLVIAPPRPGLPVHALPRITVQGEASRIDPASELHAPARAAYLARFPQSAEMFGFADFSLFGIAPDSVRFVGGFGQATSLSAREFADALLAAG
jgi:putative heme iron utilization protein